MGRSGSNWSARELEVAGLDPDGALAAAELHDQALAAGDEGAEAADLADGVVQFVGEGDEVSGVDDEFAVDDVQLLDGSVSVEEDGAGVWAWDGGLEEEGALAAQDALKTGADVDLGTGGEEGGGLNEYGVAGVPGGAG